jgi:3-oxoacyl-[acyl-carrier-protein] synthase-3
LGPSFSPKITDWSDRKTCVLFADGAGAAVLQRGEAGIISGFTGADWYRGRLFVLSRVFRSETNFIPVRDNGPRYTVMNGREIFKFAVNKMPESILKVLEGTGYTLDDIKYFIPHQANTRIIDAAAKKLNVGREKFYVNINRYGNTSSASIAIALDEMAKEGLLLPGDLIIIAGFGAGLTYGAQLIKWTKNREKNNAV